MKLLCQELSQENLPVDETGILIWGIEMFKGLFKICWKLCPNSELFFKVNISKSRFLFSAYKIECFGHGIVTNIPFQDKT